ncbi:hypothetical protein EON66_11520, partial [archaeon]
MACRCPRVYHMSCSRDLKNKSLLKYNWSCPVCRVLGMGWKARAYSGPHLYTLDASTWSLPPAATDAVQAALYDAYK